MPAGVGVQDKETSGGREVEGWCFVWFLGDVYGGEGRLQLVLCCSARDEREGRSVGSLSGFQAGIFLLFL